MVHAGLPRTFVVHVPVHEYVHRSAFRRREREDKSGIFGRNAATKEDFQHRKVKDSNVYKEIPLKHIKCGWRG
jgi:hypothetical protein